MGSAIELLLLVNPDKAKSKLTAAACLVIAITFSREYFFSVSDFRNWNITKSALAEEISNVLVKLNYNVNIVSTIHYLRSYKEKLRKLVLSFYSTSLFKEPVGRYEAATAIARGLITKHSMKIQLPEADPELVAKVTKLLDRV